MKTKLTLLLIVSLFLKSGLAEAGVGEKAFGATIKTVVKGVIAVTNIENVKKKIVAKLEATDDEYYNLRYSNFYHLIIVLLIIQIKHLDFFIFSRRYIHSSSHVYGKI